MAENLDTPAFGNFSIENTMDMGMGSAELLNDLMGPETASSAPDDIKEMTEEDKAPKAEPKKAPAKAEATEEAPEKKEDPSKSIEDFLLGGGDDEEEEEEEAPAPKKQKLLKHRLKKLMKILKNKKLVSLEL